MRVKAVLFDLFDTLVIVEGGEAFYPPALKTLHRTLADNGVKPLYEDFERAYYEVRDQLYEQSSKSLEEPHFNVRVLQTLRKLGYNYSVCDAIICEASMAFAGEFMKRVRLDPFTVPVLTLLRAKYRMAIVSNFAIPEAEMKMLCESDLDKFFDAVIVSGAINKRKPSPIIFKRALHQLGTDPSDAVFVGDTPYADIWGAKEAGMRTVLIQRGSPAIDIPQSYLWKPSEQPEIQADRTITTLKELPDILKNW